MLPVDGQKDLIQVPLVVRSRTPVTQPIGIGLPEFPTPVPYRFIAQGDAAFSHYGFNIAVGQAKAEVQPDTMADGLYREPMTLVGIDIWSCVRAASVPHGAEAAQTERSI